MSSSKQASIGFFGKYLTIWVLICIVLGIAIGQFLPSVPEFLSKLEYARVSLPVAILIWLMIYPMMLKVDFASIVRVTKRPKGLAVTTVTNWLIKPFTMYIIAFFFLKVVFRPWINDELGTEYLAGAVLLGAAPCTAMVFVWSHLSDGDPAYTVVQVAVKLVEAPVVSYPVPSPPMPPVAEADRPVARSPQNLRERKPLHGLVGVVCTGSMPVDVPTGEH